MAEKLGFLPGIFNAIGSTWIFALMVLINLDVFSRFLFNSPIRGVPLVVSMSIIAIVFLQVSDALRHGRLTRNDVLIGRFLKGKREIGLALQSAYHLAGAVVMGLIFYFTINLFNKAWISEAYLGNRGDFTFAEWPIKLLILFGSIICFFQFLALCVKDIREAKSITGSIASRQVVLVYLGAFCIALLFSMGIADGLSDIGIGILSVVLILVLVYIGVHVSVALAGLSFLCIWLLRDDPNIAGKMLASAAGEALQRYEFGVIPLFVMMGFLVSISDIGKDTYEVANQLFRKIKGGLGTATVFANAVFAAVTGTSIASASVFTKVAVPEMIRHGYHRRFAVGVVAGSSVLGMLIPPSLLLILYGILSESSIGDLFIAGIVPGIVLSIAYALLISFMAHRYPKRVFVEDSASSEISVTFSTSEIWLKLAPILILITIVLGGIYGGIFTATEAGAVGALGALLLSLIKRKLTWPKMWQVLVETGHVTAALSFLLIGAHVYSRMIAVTGIPDVMDQLINSSGIGFTGLIITYLCIIILLGTILDAGSILLIMVPLFVPVLVGMEAEGVETNGLIWFGIVTIVAVEIGLLTPPLGLACFVIHNNLRENTDISINDVFWGAFPFAVTMFLVLLLIVIFPDITLFLTEIRY
ncbi:MAG: TRAP transporter large permease subunit [Rhodospirillales bacterium]